MKILTNNWKKLIFYVTWRVHKKQYESYCRDIIRQFFENFFGLRLLEGMGKWVSHKEARRKLYRLADQKYERKLMKKILSN